MEDDNILFGEDLSTEYTVVYKDFNNVLKDIEFANDDERLLCSSIIESLEIELATQFRNDKCVNIPYIGKLQKNIVKRNVLKNYKRFKEVSQNLTIQERREFFRAAYAEEKEKQKELANEKKKNKVIINKNYNKYISLSRKKGMAFAELYFKFKAKLEYVPFNQEIHDAYVESLSD